MIYISSDDHEQYSKNQCDTVEYQVEHRDEYNYIYIYQLNEKNLAKFDKKQTVAEKYYNKIKISYYTRFMCSMWR